MLNNCENPDRNCLGCELKSPLFCFLTDQELEEINRTKLSVVFRKGETIRKQGTFMSHVISLTSGLAKLYLEGIDQRNAILRIVKPTNFIGGPGIYADLRHHFTVTALTDTSVCFIDVNLFKDIIDRNKVFAREFMKDFSGQVLSVHNRLLCLTQKQMPGRMADSLIYLFDEIFGSDRFPLHLSRQDLADLSAMSKESALKVLRDFQQEEIIRLTDKEMILLNHEALRRISRIG